MTDNETLCFICDRQATTHVAGVFLCNEHTAQATAFREDRRAHNRPANISVWASRQRTKALTHTSVRLSPGVLEKADKLADELGISRNALIEMLIMEK